MAGISDEKLDQLENIVSKMPLELFCTVTLPDLGIPWRDVVNNITKNRLPMNPRSVSQIIRHYASLYLEEDQIDDKISMLKLKLAIRNTKQWHTITMWDDIFGEEDVCDTLRMLPTRVLHAAMRIVATPNVTPEVHSTCLGDFLYLSVYLKSPTKISSQLYIALTAREPVAFVSSLTHKKMLQAAVEGIGYKNYKDAQLHGPDITSLFRIIDRNMNHNINHLINKPELITVPEVNIHGFNFTNKTCISNYVDDLLGPEPPLLSHLEVTSVKPFFDGAVLNKNMKISLVLKSDNIAESLKEWVVEKVIGPESSLLNVFHSTKSNRVIFDSNMSDGED